MAASGSATVTHQPPHRQHPGGASQQRRQVQLHGRSQALALAMEVSVLEAKRLGHRPVRGCRGCGRLGRPVDPAPVAVAPPSLVGYLTAGATPVWLLGSFAVLSLLYRADTSADPVAAAAEVSAERRQASTEVQQPGAAVLTKRPGRACLCRTQRHRRGGQRWALAAAAGLSASYARALVAGCHAQPPTAVQRNGRRPTASAAGAGPEARS
jgi:hypothetical protein